MQRRQFLYSLAVCSGALTAGCSTGRSGSQSGRWYLYVGTYTGQNSKGIYVFRFDAGTGAIEPLGLAAEVASPSFLAVHPNGQFLYCVNETDKWGNQATGAVTAFKIDRPSGRLIRLNDLPSGGPGPCHLTVDRSGRSVLVANYSGGSVASFQLNADGSLGAMTSFFQHQGSSVNAARQKEPHGHSINPSPDNHFAFAADLGLDKVMIYRLDGATGALAPHDPPYVKVAPGSGPRHFAFHPGGRFAYVINEMACTVTAFNYNAAKGSLGEIQTVSTLPAGVAVKPEYSTAEIVAHPSGRFVYGSNRGHDTIAVFSVASDGRLTLVQNASTQGRIPRNFALDPTGRYLFAENQSSGTIVVFTVDPANGTLTPTGRQLEVGSPVCIRFAPAP